MKQSPYQLHSSCLQVQVSILCSTCVYYGVFQTSLHMKRKLTLRNMRASLLLLSELSISALPSHSCLHVQELHTTDRQTDTHLEP